MLTHVALLRGINVGGKNILPMKDLAGLFRDAGCTNVCTYIQSGNVVFKAEKSSQLIATKVAAAIEKRWGFRSPVIVRSAQDWRKTIQNNSFIATVADQKCLHVYFLADSPHPRALAALDSARSAPDVFHVVGREIYLHLPNGMGRTKLTNAYFDAKLQTVCTARNWATVLKLAEMMEEG